MDEMMNKSTSRKHYSDDVLRNPVGLIHEIDRLTHERLKAFAPPMQRSCRMILMHLARMDNVTQLDLVHTTHLKAPTVSVCLQKMEAEGYVERRPDEHDMRAMRVLLTDKGKELDRSVVSKIHEQEQCISDCLTDEEKSTLIRLLSKIRTNLLEDQSSREN